MEKTLANLPLHCLRAAGWYSNSNPGIFNGNFNPKMEMNMSFTTNSLVAKVKKLAVPAGILATLLFVLAFFIDHNKAMAAAAGPLDDSSVSSLVALDNAVEAVAARVTPAVVNVSVTSRVSDDQQGDGDGRTQNFGGINPQDLPPGFRQFFFGQNGPGGGQGMKPQPQIEHGVGSGVIISPDGYIVTNDHVVDGATELRVTLNDRRVFTAKVVGEDKLNDLAVIKIDAHDLPSIPWGESTKLHPGQTVLAFGSPFGYFQFSVTRGIISALNRPNPYSDDARKPGDFIQTDAAINPGNSGGPLVDAHGELIGIDTFIISNSGSFAGAGFAIPSEIAKASVDQIIKTGTVHHGYLGLSMNDVTPENAQFFNLPDASGAIVSQVTPDSPASRAGLKSGDVLRELDGRKILNGGALQVAVSETAPGAAIELGILRDGKPETLRATLGEFHKEAAEEASNGGSGEQRGRLGLTVADLSPDVRQQLHVPEQVHGAAVAEVRPGSAADNAGLTAGDVILEVDRHPVTDADNFVSQIHAVPQNKDVLLLVWSNGGASYRVVHPEANAESGM
jgi:serine protease Do